MKRIWQRPEIVIALCFLAFVLTLTPYYNHLYRVSINHMHIALFWVSLFIAGLMLIQRCIHRARFRRVLPVLVLGLLVLLASTQVHRWRYSITSAYIESHYCGGKHAGDPILGGITEIRAEGIESTGAFENSSHCVFVFCAEEFYYCDDAIVVIGP